MCLLGFVMEILIITDNWHYFIWNYKCKSFIWLELSPFTYRMVFLLKHIARFNKYWHHHSPLKSVSHFMFVSKKGENCFVQSIVVKYSFYWVIGLPLSHLKLIHFMYWQCVYKKVIVLYLKQWSNSPFQNLKDHW